MCDRGAWENSRGSDGLKKEETELIAWAERKLKVLIFVCGSVIIWSMGEQAWNANSGHQIPFAPHFGLEYPTGSGREHIYGAGPG